MIINSSSEKSFNDIDVIGIAISREASKNLNHIAILYKFDGPESSPSLLHIGWHNQLLNNLPKPHYLWLDLSDDFDPISKQIIAAHVHKIAIANPESSAKYGFDVNAKYIDPETGQFKSTMKMVGLTCATFVLEVFESCGFGLIDWEAWPKGRASDIKWQNKIIKTLYSTIPDISEEYINRQRVNIGNSRYLPEEVAASTQIEIPASKKQIKRPAQLIRKKLIQHTRSN